MDALDIRQPPFGDNFCRRSKSSLKLSIALNTEGGSNIAFTPKRKVKSFTLDKKATREAMYGSIPSYHEQFFDKTSPGSAVVAKDIDVKMSMVECCRTIAINFASGFIAFLLSATIAVSCASVVVGHGTPLSHYVSQVIDMNFLGTSIVCIILAFKSTAPWTLGSIDVFV